MKASRTSSKIILREKTNGRVKMRRATITNKKENLYWRVIISYIHSLRKKQEARDSKIQQITETIARWWTPISPRVSAQNRKNYNPIWKSL